MNMKSIKRCVLIGAVVISTGLSLPAVADHGGGGWHGGGGGWHGGGGGWHGGGWHGSSWHSDAWWGLGIGLGVGYLASTLASPSYYYSSYPAYYYPAPTYYAAPAYYGYAPAQVITPPAQTVQTAAAPGYGPQPGQSFYYCAPTHGYYPNVRSCTVPWQIVPSTPPGAVQ
ncbi:MAG: hypothetical protein ACOH2R_28355 [Pseudomonas sp.]